MAFFCSKDNWRLDCRDTRNKRGGDGQPYVQRIYKCGKCGLKLITHERIDDWSSAGAYASGQSPREKAGAMKAVYEAYETESNSWFPVSVREAGINEANRRRLKAGLPSLTTKTGFLVRLKGDPV